MKKIACGASVSVWFLSVKKPISKFWLREKSAQKPHRNACYAGYEKEVSTR